LSQPLDPQFRLPNKKVRVTEPQPCGLRGGDAAAPVDPDDLTRDVSGVLVLQHANHVHDFYRSTDPVQWDDVERTRFAFRSPLPGHWAAHQ
jgi:hypothetical protein